MRSQFYHIQVQFSMLLLRPGKLLNNCITNTRDGKAGDLRWSNASWCSFFRHTWTSPPAITLLPLTRSTYQPWAFWCPSAAVEDPCLSLSYCAGWFCTGPRSCCCCWMCCCSLHQRAFLWSLNAKQHHKNMQRTVKAQLGEWFNIQEFSVSNKSTIMEYCPGTNYIEWVKHPHNSAVSLILSRCYRNPQANTDAWGLTERSVRSLGPLKAMLTWGRLHVCPIYFQWG